MSHMALLIQYWSRYPNVKRTETNSLMVYLFRMLNNDTISRYSQNQDNGPYLLIIFRSGWGHNKECEVADTIAQMTIEEFRDMLDDLIERKLIEVLGEPDEGLGIRESVRERLIRQRDEVAAGERGQSLEVVAKELEVD